jgi:hypothetical protein
MKPRLSLIGPHLQVFFGSISAVIGRPARKRSPVIGIPSVCCCNFSKRPPEPNLCLLLLGLFGFWFAFGEAVEQQQIGVSCC